MASAGKVDVTVRARVKPSIGPSTLAGGSVTLVAYVLAIVAYFQGARDEATISALVVGTVSLVTVLGGRYTQAIVALLPLARSSWGAEKEPASTSTIAGAGTQFVSTFNTPAVTGAYVKNTVPEVVEDGDPDALPDYTTIASVPPDEGDAHARPEATP